MTVLSCDGKLFDLMEEISEELAAISESSLIVSVDQHFNVKGIGLVAIGYVQSGKVDVHDELFILPAKGTGTTKITSKLWMMMFPLRAQEIGLA